MLIPTLPTAVNAEEEGSGNRLFLLAPGAGSSYTSPGMVEHGETLGQFGKVLRFNFPYRELGKSMPDRMPELVRFLRGLADWAQENFVHDKVYLAGHSMGGRAWSMLAAEGYKADGLILFAYPLHPSGQPTKLRREHLSQVQMPTLSISGTQDELCTASLMDAEIRLLSPELWTHRWIESADHSLKVNKKQSGRTNAEVRSEIEDAIRLWLHSVEGTADLAN